MIPFRDPPRPGLQEELRALRAAEKVMASRAAMAQFVEARLCGIFGYTADVHVDYDAKPGEWRHVDKKAGLVRHGRTTVLPPKSLIENPAAWPFYMAPDVAQKVILRDSGEYGPKAPI